MFPREADSSLKYWRHEAEESLKTPEGVAVYVSSHSVGMNSLTAEITRFALYPRN